MNRRIAAFAATAALAGSALALPGIASASSQAPIRSYTGHSFVNLTGVGRATGWYDDNSYTWQVKLSPVAERWVLHNSGFAKNGKKVSQSAREVLVGHSVYAEINNGAWKRSTVTNAELKEAAADLNPYTIQAEFDALPGAQQENGYTQVTGSYAQLGSFLDLQFGLNSTAVTGNKITRVTMRLFDGPAGRPIKVTAFGNSSIVHLRSQITFGNWNKPVTIHAPA
jgi:hypothetical protein